MSTLVARRRFSAAQLRAQRAFASRYGGKRSRRSSSPSRVSRRRATPRVNTMARRRKSSRRSSRRFGGISTSTVLDGVMAGAGANLGARYLGPTWGPAAGLAAVGVWRKNPTIQLLAGISAGSNLASTFDLPGAGASPSGGVL